MKASIVCCCVAGILMVVQLRAYSAPPEQGANSDKEERTVQSLLGGLGCGNRGVQECAMWLLGELKVQRSVVPLMYALHNGSSDRCRLIAALALCRLGDSRGTYAVRRAVEFDRSEEVRLACAWFYNTYVQEGTFLLAPVPEPVVAEMLRSE